MVAELNLSSRVSNTLLFILTALRYHISNIVYVSIDFIPVFDAKFHLL